LALLGEQGIFTEDDAPAAQDPIAIAAMRTSIRGQQSPSHLRAQVALRSRFAIREAARFIDEGDLERADQCLEPLDSDPDLSPFVRHLRGRIALQRGDLDHAQDHFLLAKERWHDRGEAGAEAMACAGLGVVAWQAKEILSAERWLRHAFFLLQGEGIATEWVDALLVGVLDSEPDVGPAPPLSCDMVRSAIRIGSLRPDGVRCWLGLPSSAQALLTSLRALTGNDQEADKIYKTLNPGDE